jgi:CRISPR-associated endonuclease Cas1
MQFQPTASELIPSKLGVLVVDGYGVKVRVERGHLAVADGIGPNRREGRFARATGGVTRLVLLGHTGFVTLEALRWLADVGIAWIHLDPDGRVLGTSSSLGLNDPRLRRAQAMAWATPTGAAVARDILRAKLTGQSTLAASLPDGATIAATIDRMLHELDGAETPAELMVVEAAAAAAYWAGWAEIPVPWIRSDAAKVPDRWRMAGGRASPLTGNPRLAASPANAMLNYLYAILEAEARLACLAVGLDPGLGVLHADQKSRDSLALDVMEAVRPAVDSYVLGLLRNGVFRADGFHETRHGVCRLLPPISHRLAETAPTWAQKLAPVVEGVAADLLSASGSGISRLPSPLTQTNRSAGREGVRRAAARTTWPSVPIAYQRMCRGCGRDVRGDQRWCDTCRPAVKLQTGTEGLAKARALRARMHAKGLDPATSEQAKAKNREGRVRRRAEEVAWNRAHPETLDPEKFRLEVLPLINAVPVRRLARLTGLSVSYCALVRRGRYVPHPRWWTAFAGTSDGTGFSDPGSGRRRVRE